MFKRTRTERIMLPNGETWLCHVDYETEKFSVTDQLGRPINLSDRSATTADDLVAGFTDVLTFVQAELFPAPAPAPDPTPAP